MSTADKPGADLERLTRQVARLRSRLDDLQREQSARSTDRAALEDASALYSAILDAVPAEIAVLDATGEIIAVNRAWLEFAAENGLKLDQGGVGTSYIDPCFKGNEDSAAAREAGNGIRAVLEGRAQSYSIEYDCHGPDTPRWFRMMAAPVAAERFSGAVVIHVDITERKLAEEQIAHQAQHDPLTGLPNRRLLDDRLKQAIALARRQKHLVAVLYLDLDGFKEVNDRHGHARGDGVLMDVSARLLASIRDTDTLARTGGDEFTLVAGQLGHPEAAELIARKLGDEVAAPLSLPDPDLQLSASIGIAIYPLDGEDAADLQRKADAAMYQAKQAGGHTFRRAQP